jgi:hypothetical protein
MPCFRRYHQATSGDAPHNLAFEMVGWYRAVTRA